MRITPSPRRMRPMADGEATAELREIVARALRAYVGDTYMPGEAADIVLVSAGKMADAVLAALAAHGRGGWGGAGEREAPPTVWMVENWHTPWVSHGYEPEALFSTEAAANEYAAKLNAALDPSRDKEKNWSYEYEVSAWTVDDRRLAGAGRGSGENR